VQLLVVGIKINVNVLFPMRVEVMHMQLTLIEVHLPMILGYGKLTHKTGVPALVVTHLVMLLPIVVVQLMFGVGVVVLSVYGQLVVVVGHVVKRLKLILNGMEHGLKIMMLLDHSLHGLFHRMTHALLSPSTTRCQLKKSS